MDPMKMMETPTKYKECSKCGSFYDARSPRCPCELISEYATDNARLRLALQQAREALEAARTQLRATQENWHEDCLFEADDILTAALEAIRGAL